MAHINTSGTNNDESRLSFLSRSWQVATLLKSLQILKKNVDEKFLGDTYLKAFLN